MKTKSFILLLTCIVSLWILNSTISQLLQQRLPLTVISTSSSLFMSSTPSTAPHLASLPRRCMKKNHLVHYSVLLTFCLPLESVKKKTPHFFKKLFVKKKTVFVLCIILFSFNIFNNIKLWVSREIFHEETLFFVFICMLNCKCIVLCFPQRLVQNQHLQWCWQAAQ